MKKGIPGGFKGRWGKSKEGVQTSVDRKESARVKSIKKLTAL